MTGVIAVTAAALAVQGVAAPAVLAAPTPQQRIAKLQAQVKTLKTNLKAARADALELSRQLEAMTAQRDDLIVQVSTANQGAVQAISVMSEATIFDTVLPVIRQVFSGGSEDYTVSFFQSGSYVSYDLTRATFG
ncbi:MAG: hypothetical protein R3C15_15595 [Thermoleophilia bacterium]